MIKEEGVDLSYMPPPQIVQHVPQKQQNSECFSSHFQYSYLYQNHFLSYPSPPPWTFEHRYHAYNSLAHAFPHYGSSFCQVAPPLQPSGQINQQQIKTMARPTRSEEESQKNVKMEENGEKQKALTLIPSEYRHELSRRGASRKKRQKYTSYYWSMQENKRYLQFLISHPGLFDLSINVKKNLRVNVMMSKKVKTRSPQQCHSHHQKMIKKHGSIDLVIVALKNERDQMNPKPKQQEDQVKVEELCEDNRPEE